MMRLSMKLHIEVATSWWYRDTSKKVHHSHIGEPPYLASSTDRLANYRTDSSSPFIAVNPQMTWVVCSCRFKDEFSSARENSLN